MDIFCDVKITFDQSFLIIDIFVQKLKLIRNPIISTNESRVPLQPEMIVFSPNFISQRTHRLITKTCPCNIQRLFSVVKYENSVRKILIFFLFLLKT